MIMPYEPKRILVTPMSKKEILREFNKMDNASNGFTPSMFSFNELIKELNKWQLHTNLKAAILSISV